MSAFKVIGLAGRAGSGKDYLAQHCLTPLGFRQFSFAWHLKVWAVGRGDATHEEVFETKPPHIRKLLQEDGTERGRNVYGQDVWLKVTAEWMRVLHENMGIEKFVIPDVRFPNEADFIKSMGGMLVQIVAPERSKNSGLTEEARRHPSETSLDGYTGFHAIIHNDPSDVNAEKQLTQCVEKFFDDPVDCTDEFRILDVLSGVIEEVRNLWWI